MAIYHFKMTTVSRGRGDSAVAKAAYNAAEKLTDPRTGETHDRRSKAGHVVADGLVGYDGTRGDLWGAVEQAEKHPRACTARGLVLALPHELTDEQRLALTIGFAEWLRARHGVAVDWAVHREGAGDSRNVHAHMQMTTRQVEAGKIGAKTRELDTQPSGGDHITAWREEWAFRTNEALRLAGLSIKVDHRSHAARGTGQAPQEHLGAAASALERKGIRTTRGDRNRARISRHISSPATTAAIARPINLGLRSAKRLGPDLGLSALDGLVSDHSPPVR